MININEYIQSTEEVQFGDTVLHVHDLSTELFNACLEPTEGLDAREIFSKQEELVCRILNRNAEGQKVELEELKNWPVKAIDALLAKMIARARLAVNDPN